MVCAISLQTCYWCTKCKFDKCLPIHKDCEPYDDGNKCRVFEREKSSTRAFQPPERSCLIQPCTASTCDRCAQMGCIWTQHFERILHSAGKFVHFCFYGKCSKILNTFLFLFSNKTGYQGRHSQNACQNSKQGRSWQSDLGLLCLAGKLVPFCI